MTKVRFGDVVPSVDHLMGVKAVWGRSSAPVMCFGSRGDPVAKDRAHYTQGRATAEKAIERPYLVTIGGGDEVPLELDGRILELVRVTGVYGESTAFVVDPALRDRLDRWPIAVVTSEVYRVDGEPHLIQDLRLPNRMILANAFDSVRRDEDRIGDLFNRLKDLQITRRWDIQPLPEFRDPRKVQLVNSFYPRVSASSTEGRRIHGESVKLERDRKLAKAAKELNRSRNGGSIVCEGCALTEADGRLFDAHHLDPLATGIRITLPDDFAVLCPTCHRWAHAKAPDKLQPLAISVLQLVVREQQYARKQLAPV